MFFRQVRRVSLHFILSSGESAQFFTLTQGALYGTYKGTIPFTVKGELRNALQVNADLFTFFEITSLYSYFPDSSMVENHIT